MKKDWLWKVVGNWLKKDRQRAEDVLAYAFPGERLGKYRSDRGLKKNKIKLVYVDPPYGDYPKAGE
jgi:16S rRNA G966 N2-methylase RsmD